MINHLTTQAEACPDQKFVLGGHSQGGVVTVQVIPQLPEDVLSRVIAVTMVGSPDCPAEVEDRCRSYCNDGDFVSSAPKHADLPRTMRLFRSITSLINLPDLLRRLRWRIPRTRWWIARARRWLRRLSRTWRRISRSRRWTWGWVTRDGRYVPGKASTLL